jgi:hypothetical protein
MPGATSPVNVPFLPDLVGRMFSDLVAISLEPTFAVSVTFWWAT